MKALLIKRLLLYRRSYKAFAMEILIPFLLIFVGFQLSKISFYFNSPQKMLTPDVFGPERILINKDTILETGFNKYGVPSQVLSPQDFISKLPGDDLF